MGQRRVFILVTDRDSVTEVAVQALVVVHCLLAEAHQPHAQADEEKCGVNAVLNAWGYREFSRRLDYRRARARDRGPRPIDPSRAHTA